MSVPTAIATEESVLKTLHLHPAKRLCVPKTTISGQPKRSAKALFSTWKVPQNLS